MLQRTATARPERSGRGTIRRLVGSGYYLLCGPAEEGATAVGDGRFYRTVDTLPDGAVKAKSQPFKVWNLYEPPAPEPVAPVEAEVDEDEGTEEQVEEVATAPSTGAAPKLTKGQKKRARKKAKAPTEPERGTAEQESEQDAGPTEPAWIIKNRQTSPLKGEQLEANIKGLASERAGIEKDLERRLAALATAWVPEMEAGVEGIALADRQAALRAGMPWWDGDQATAMKAIPAMTSYLTDKVTPAVEVAKSLGVLKGLVESEGLTELLSAFGPAAAIAYAKEMGNERLKVLLVDRKVPAASLLHYGAKMMKVFVGAGAAAWTHVTTATEKSDGVISGGHDEKVFLDFIAAKGYELDRAYPSSDLYKVRYQKVGGPVLGSKTLIKGLTGAKDAWLKRFNDAIWKGICDKSFTVGQYTVGTGNDRYSGFYNAGKAEVDTVFPV